MSNIVKDQAANRTTFSGLCPLVQQTNGDKCTANFQCHSYTVFQEHAKHMTEADLYV